MRETKRTPCSFWTVHWNKSTYNFSNGLAGRLKTSFTWYAVLHPPTVNLPIVGILLAGQWVLDPFNRQPEQTGRQAALERPQASYMSEACGPAVWGLWTPGWGGGAAEQMWWWWCGAWGQCLSEKRVARGACMFILKTAAGYNTFLKGGNKVHEDRRSCLANVTEPHEKFVMRLQLQKKFMRLRLRDLLYIYSSRSIQVTILGGWWV
jgi:hypothetical protein